MKNIILVLFTIILSGCTTNKTFVNIPGSGDNAIDIRITVKEDKATSTSPSIAVSQGSASAISEGSLEKK